MEDPTPFGLYLGCTHRKFQATFKYGDIKAACPTIHVPNKTTNEAEDRSRDNRTIRATGIEYDCQPYLLGVVQRYAAQILRETGKPVVLNRVGTPFLTDSATREAPQRRPVSPDSHLAHTCPFCKTMFIPDDDTKGDRAKEMHKKQLETVVTPPEGALWPVDPDGTPEQDGIPPPSERKMNKFAASILMGLMYIARIGRYDLLKSVNVLTSKLTRWDITAEMELHRLMCYVWTTLGYRMVGWIASDAKDLGVHLFTDADLAGCPYTMRSTTGIHICLGNQYSQFPILAVSKRQGSTAVSTPEAELLAGNHGLRYELVPLLDVCDLILDKNHRAIHHEDNSAMIQIVKTGRNLTMRYMERLHGIAIASLNELIYGAMTMPVASRLTSKYANRVCLHYEASPRMAADIYTKAFANGNKWSDVLALIGIRTPTQCRAMNIKIVDKVPLPEGATNTGKWVPVSTIDFSSTVDKRKSGQTYKSKKAQQKAKAKAAAKGKAKAAPRK